MAKLTGPLLSLDAHGAIRHGPIYQSWKSLHVARKPFSPHQPGSAGQLDEKAAVTSCTAFFRITLNNPTQKTGWRNFARATNSHWHSANAFNHIAIPAFRQGHTAHFALAFTPLESMRIAVTFGTLDGSTPDQTPANVHMRYALTLTGPTTLLDPDSDPTNTIFTVPVTAGTTVYAFVEIAGRRASGTCAVVLLAPPPNLVTNPHFTSAAGWTFESHWAWKTNEAYCVYYTGTYQWLRQTVPISPLTDYDLTVKFIDCAYPAILYVALGTDGLHGPWSGQYGAGVRTCTLKSDASGTGLGFMAWQLPGYNFPGIEITDVILLPH
jgi:hypothetical protein